MRPVKQCSFCLCCSDMFMSRLCGCEGHHSTSITGRQRERERVGGARGSGFLQSHAASRFVLSIPFPSPFHWAPKENIQRHAVFKRKVLKKVFLRGGAVRFLFPFTGCTHSVNDFHSLNIFYMRLYCKYFSCSKHDPFRNSEGFCVPSLIILLFIPTSQCDWLRDILEALESVT